MMRNGLVFLLGILLLAGPAMAREGKEGVFTLWPLIDYRFSSVADYTSLNLLCPLFSYKKKGTEHKFGLRPLYFTARDTARETRYSEFLYPVGIKKSEPHRSFFQGLHLFDYDFGSSEKGSDNEFMLFPFIFYGGENKEHGSYFAFFPVGGKIYDKFGRNEIRFAVFPVYLQTRKKDTTTTNILWPIFAGIYGKQESGLKVWPLFGHSQKEGVYRKRFYLWPVVFLYDLRLDTDNPTHIRNIFPLYTAENSPQYSSRSYLWPFFGHVEDLRKNYEEWNFPWPLLRISYGTYKESRRFLPFYANERVGDSRKRWFLWPVYKIEETQTDVLDRRRDRILYFLYSNLEETVREEGSPRKKRVALWPLFTYEKIKGVSHFYTLSLLEPFFPENEGIARNWSPLWRLYQHKWDTHGNKISSLLWNLYWKERRGLDLAVEIFPLFFYQREAGSGSDFKLLKGLFRYRAGADGKKINILYLPWEISWQVKD
jgi:hypothetical protein